MSWTTGKHESGRIPTGNWGMNALGEHEDVKAELAEMTNDELREQLNRLAVRMRTVYDPNDGAETLFHLTQQELDNRIDRWARPSQEARRG